MMPGISIGNKNKSDADIVEDALNNVFGYVGEPLNDYTLNKIEYDLKFICNYVTIIATCLHENIYGDLETIFIYNDDAVQFYIYHIALENSYGDQYSRYLEEYNIWLNDLGRLL